MKMATSLHFRLLLIISLFTCIQNAWCTPIRLLLDECNRPTPALEELLNVLSVEHDGTLDSIIDATQKAWLRPPGVNRWEMKERFYEKRFVLLPLFTQLGLVHSILPTRGHYTYALVHSNVIRSFRRRLAFLTHMWSSGIRFGALIFLCSAEPIYPEIEHAGVLFNNTCQELSFKSNWCPPEKPPITQKEMMEMVFEQTELPQDMQHLPIFFMEAPMRTLKNGTIARPNTATTIQEWLAANPYPGSSCLFISDQPYVGYQDIVARTCVPETFNMETVGMRAEPGEKIAIFLDTITRTLYQERKRRRMLEQQSITSAIRAEKSD